MISQEKEKERDDKEEKEEDDEEENENIDIELNMELLSSLPSKEYSPMESVSQEKAGVTPNPPCHISQDSQDTFKSPEGFTLVANRNEKKKIYHQNRKGKEKEPKLLQGVRSQSLSSGLSVRSSSQSPTRNGSQVRQASQSPARIAKQSDNKAKGKSSLH